MDILNFISWIKGSRIVSTADATRTLIPLGLKDSKRDDGYLAGAISVEDFLALVPVPPGPDFSNYNTPYGELALNSVTIGDRNNAYGYKALYNITEGYSNIGIGYESLYNVTIAFSNIAIGERSLYNNIANGNLAIGNFTLSQNTTGYGNIAIGDSALENSSAGKFNVAVGANTLNHVSNGEFNTSIGTSSSLGVTTGDFNTAIGAYSNYSSNFNDCISIGVFSQPTGDNQIVFGSSSHPSGAIAAEAVIPTKSWTVKINGVDYKIALQVA